MNSIRKNKDMSLKFIENTRWLMRTKHILVGDMETECGLPKGFLSKKTKHGVISMDVAYAIAEYLHTDIDTILHLENYLAKEVEE